MDILSHLYTLLLIQPVYNLVIAIYATLAQQSAAITFILVGIAAATIHLPGIINNYQDSQLVRAHQSEIDAIQTSNVDNQQKQQQVLAFLRTKGIRFQNESIYLFGQAIVLFLLNPILTNHWRIESSLLYSFTSVPEQLSASVGNILVTHSSPTLSLVPAILLFFELRLSYKEQRFLTGFVDRWYAVILPLCTYFLVFWLPSGLSIALAASLTVSLYIKMSLQFFTKLRHQRAHVS